MTDEEILNLWKSGLSKFKVANIYKINYNNRIKIIRLNPKGRNARFISNYEALSKVEHIVYDYIRRCNKWN